MGSPHQPGLADEAPGPDSPAPSDEHPRPSAPELIFTMTVDKNVDQRFLSEPTAVNLTKQRAAPGQQPRDPVRTSVAGLAQARAGGVDVARP